MNNNNQHIIFRLKEKIYAIDIKNVTEVINMPSIEVMQNAPEGISGILNYKGSIIKVIDICPMLGLQPDDFNINNQLIIININNNCYAIKVDKVLNIITLIPENIIPMPFDSNDSVLNKIYKTDSDLINILDINILDNTISNSTNQGKVNYLDLIPKDEKSKQVLKAREEHYKHDNNITSFELNTNIENQYILFCINNNNYYIGLKYVRELTSIKRVSLTKIPYAPEYIKGIINLRGQFILTIDLKIFLNIKNSATPPEKLIVIEGKDFDIAILVDEIKYINHLNNLSPVTVNLNDHTGYIASEFIEDNRLYNILNIEKILSDEKLFININ